MEGKEEALLKRIDDLSADQLEMSEAIDTLKRYTYLKFKLKSLITSIKASIRRIDP